MNNLISLISDPEDNDPRFAKLVRNIIIFSIVGNLLILLLVSGLLIPGTFNPLAFTTLSITLALEITAFILVLLGSLVMAKIIVPIGLLAAVTILAVSANGAHDISMQAYSLIIIISVLLNRRKSIFVFTPLTIFAIEVVYYFDLAGLTPSTMSQKTELDDAVISGVLILIMSFVLHLMMTRLEQSVSEARSNEQVQISTNQELLELQASLEKRVDYRTAALAIANEINERRASQFQAISQVSRAIASLQDISDLLPNITKVISDRFGFYHVGIFLLDETKQFAILSAANSVGGQQMLANGHRLRVGEVGIVGYTASTGIPRIALDTGTDSTYFNNPNLQGTRSEVALPLQISNKLIGVLDVQSTEENAFVQDDIELLTTLADQVAIAIRNAQLYRQSQTAISESQMFMGNYLIETWKNASTNKLGAGYRFTGTMPTPTLEQIDSPEIQTAMKEGRMISSTQGKKSTLSVPIKIRDEVIGIININTPDLHEWDTDEIDMIQAAAQRTSLALENSSLLEETQRRASKEKIISEISTKISSMLDIDNLLQTTIQEMARTIPGAEVAIQLEDTDRK